MLTHVGVERLGVVWRDYITLSSGFSYMAFIKMIWCGGCVGGDVGGPSLNIAFCLTIRNVLHINLYLFYTYLFIYLMQAIRTTQLSCDLCVLNFTSQSQMDQHMDGKNHLKKLANESGNSNNFNSQKQESNWDSHPVIIK